MTERIYISLKEASEHLQAKGLTGQTPHMLRTAIAMEELAAVKDGGSWKTTIPALDEYEAALWRKFAPHIVIAKYSPWLSREDAFYEVTKPVEKPAPRPKAKAPKRERPRSRQKTPKQKWDVKLTPEQEAEYSALSDDERKQRWRDYLDGKREHWRY